MPLCVHMLLFSSIPAEPSIILSPSVLVFKKAHQQSANDFYFGEQELQASMKVSSANFANNGLCWLLFLTLNLQYTFVFLPNSNWFVKLHRARYPFPFFFPLVSLVVGIVYTDLHEVLLTDQPIRDKTGKERWRYLSDFINQMQL